MSYDICPMSHQLISCRIMPDHIMSYHIISCHSTSDNTTVCHGMQDSGCARARAGAHARAQTCIGSCRHVG